MVLLTTTGQWCITEATTSRRSTGVLRRSSTYSKHSLVLGFVGWVGARQRFERGAATWLANNAAFTAKVTARPSAQASGDGRRALAALRKEWACNSEYKRNWTERSFSSAHEFVRRLSLECITSCSQHCWVQFYDDFWPKTFLKVRIVSVACCLRFSWMNNSALPECKRYISY